MNVATRISAPRRRQAFAVALWALLLVFAALNMRELKEQLPRFADGAADFKIFYTGASVIALGQGPHLYDLRLQSLVQQTAYPPSNGAASTLPFNHPAYELLVFVPLAFLSPGQAYAVWFAFNVLLLLATVMLLSRLAAPAVPIALIFAASAPVITALLQGQDSILLLFIYVATYALLRAGRQWWAGAVLALGLFKFHLVLPFVLVFVVARRMWKMLGGFAASGLLIVVMSVAMTGVAGALRYPAFQLQLQKTQPWMFVPSQMVNLHGLIATYLADRSGVLTLLASMAVLAVSFVVASRRRESGIEDAFSLGILCTLLVGYHSFAHDLSLLVLPVVILMGVGEGRKQLVALVAGLVLISPFSYLYVQPRSLLCLALLAMAAGVFHRLAEPVPTNSRISC